ncbi:hypothetical protein JVX93_19095 [Mycolicibacterium boenickei]|nr:hypothetical protein JVX93_19095 [Mycolicibacterium boenickei]
MSGEAGSTGELPRRGEFEGQAVVGPFTPDAVSMNSDEPLFGMPPEALYLWGTLRDDDGDLHTIMRRIPHHGRPTSRRRLIVQSTTGGADALRMHPSGLGSAPHVDPIRTLVDEQSIEWRSNPKAEGSPFRALWANQTCEWTEEGIFDLRGTLIGPGLQWYVPSRRASMAYIATIYKMEGTIFGKPCRGLIGFDQIHMNEGGEVYQKLDPLIEDGLEHLWYTWATCYSDGTLDAGHFMLGNKRFGFGILTDENGTVRATTDVDGEVTFDQEGYWQTGARFDFGGVEYEFLPDPRGRMPDLGPIPNPQVDGRWRRVGDDREPDVWFAWGEAVPAHGNRPLRRAYPVR